MTFTNRQILERCGVAASQSHVLPVILGSNERAMTIAAALQQRSFDIRGIRPPTVPQGTARLRIAITLNTDKDGVAAMLDALAEEMRRCPA